MWSEVSPSMGREKRGSPGGIVLVVMVVPGVVVGWWRRVLGRGTFRCALLTTEKGTLNPTSSRFQYEWPMKMEV